MKGEDRKAAEKQLLGVSLNSRQKQVALENQEGMRSLKSLSLSAMLATLVIATQTAVQDLSYFHLFF